MPLTVQSSAFKNGEPIPQLYSGEGENVSPSIAWKGAPVGTKEFALICEDPDASGGIFIHWVVYRIPSTAVDLKERMPEYRILPGSIIRQGVNSGGKIGYTGPKPPPGAAHRYFFRLYALSASLDLEPGATAAQLKRALSGNVLAEAEWMGTYQRSRA